MIQFLHELVAFFASQGILPPEVQTADVDREKTFLQTLPAAPDRVCCIRIYDGRVPTLVGKQAGIYYVQVTFRDPKQSRALTAAEKLWKFLLQRPEPIEDINPSRWVIFDAQTPPIPAGRDEKGNYLYTVNFPVKTQMY